jgi:hypothetical protein
MREKLEKQDKLVAVMNPWDKLSAVVKKKFRVESLPAEKRVAVWRDDLQTEQKLRDELCQLGITSVEVRTKNVMVSW